MFFNRTIREQMLRRPMANRHFETRNLEGRQFSSFGFEGNNWQHVNYSTPETDILELDEQYLLEIAVPGVTLDDVELKIEENLLTVIAKRTAHMYEERAEVLQKELPSYLVREFYFEQEILPESIEARLDRGILFISIPKVEVAHRIPVSAGSMELHLPGMKTRVGKTDSLRNSKEVTIK
ncbi:MAG: Hsp20/alpha crystallin family protein [Leptolyngbya sp.]|nr:Hsp20/alpha crystallin family protein [Candidatus Melainabacteria bacterium]